VIGKAIKSWDDMIVAFALNDYSEGRFQVRSADGIEREVVVTTEALMGGRFVIGMAPVSYCLIIKVEKGSPADRAGLQSGDQILEIDGARAYSRSHLADLVNAAGGREVPITFLHKGEVHSATIMPAYDEVLRRSRIGILFNTLDTKKPLEQIKSHATMIFAILKALVTPKTSAHAAKNVGGPVAIFEVFWWSVRASFMLALWFTVMVNVNLAVMNLIPIPVLDGGHIVFSLWEWITRRPPSPKFVTVVWNIFAVLLLSLILLLTFRDVKRLLPTRWFGAQAPVTNEAPAAVPAE
jgi:regulator of sigma E protease